MDAMSQTCPPANSETIRFRQAAQQLSHAEQQQLRVLLLLVLVLVWEQLRVCPHLAHGPAGPVGCCGGQCRSREDGCHQGIGVSCCHTGLGGVPHSHQPVGVPQVLLPAPDRLIHHW